MKKILLVLVAFAIVLPVMAIDLDFYGNLKLGPWWEKRERWYEDTVKVDTIWKLDTLGGIVVETTNVDLGPDSLPYTYTTFLPHGYLGAKFKSDRFGGCIELGVHKNVYEGRISGSTDGKLLARESMFITLRNWYVEWYLNDLVTILLGKTITPMTFVPSNQGYYNDNSFANTGCPYAGRRPMIQLSLGNMAAGEGGFSWESKVAVIDPDTVRIQFRNDQKSSKVETKIPKFEVSAKFNLEQEIFGLNFGGAVGYNTFTIGSHKNNAIGGLKLDSCKIPINCYAYAGAVGVKLGPVSLDFTIGGGQNTGAYGLWTTTPWVWRGDAVSEVVEIFYPFHEEVLDSLGSPIDYELQNSTAREMAVILKVKPTDWLAFEGGGGTVQAEHPHKKFSDRWNDTYAWYGNFTITVAEVLQFAPEVGQYWYGPLIGYGRTTYGGIQTRFSF